MNKAIILAVQDLESKLLAGVINEKFFQLQMGRLLEITDDPRDIKYIKLKMDREI